MVEIYPSGGVPNGMMNLNNIKRTRCESSPFVFHNQTITVTKVLLWDSVW